MKTFKKFQLVFNYLILKIFVKNTLKDNNILSLDDYYNLIQSYDKNIKLNYYITGTYGMCVSVILFICTLLFIIKNIF